MNYQIKTYNDIQHRKQVIVFWNKVFGYSSPHNKPDVAIDKKIAMDDGLFFVAINGDTVVGTVMAGYDGHRGWIYSLAVDPSHRKKGMGSALLKHAENVLSDLGCVKVNIQIMGDNKTVEAFYQKNGFSTEHRISMAKILEE